MLVLLAALGLVGVLPLVSLASHSSRRAWIFAGVAVALGATLAVWVRGRLIGKAAAAMTSLLPMWIVAVVAFGLVVRGTSVEARLVYSAAAEGFAGATVFHGVRAYRRDRTINREDQKY